MIVEPPHAVARYGLKQRVKDFARGWLAIRKAQGEFDRNLADWQRGGPTPDGWTREGPPIQTPGCTLGSVSKRLMSPDDCFAKNPAEVKRWHVGFAEACRTGADLYETAYWHEYLLPRFPREVAEQRAKRFAALYQSIATGRRPGCYTWLADFGTIPGLQEYFGFRYFRFDGAHRLACQYVLGIRQIPCLVFEVSRIS